MTPALLRAARGLLNWQQQDLATAAGLSVKAVNRFERGHGKTRAGTLKVMVAALQESGIEFLPSGGVRHADDVNVVKNISGNDFVEKLDEDIYAAVRKPGQEIYSCSADESQWFVPGIKETAKRYYEWRARLGVKQLYLVPEGNTVFESPKSHYRLLPSPLIGKIAFLIYADRVALVTWRKKQIFILRGKELVEPFRAQFKFLWQLGKKA
jgi:transcriptional regulator with XRE-family HTH domain